MRRSRRKTTSFRYCPRTAESVKWEELSNRNLEIEVVGAPVRAYSNFLRGIKSMPVRIVA